VDRPPDKGKPGATRGRKVTGLRKKAAGSSKEEERILLLPEKDFFVGWPEKPAEL